MFQFQTFEEFLGVFKRRFWIMTLIIVVGCAISVYLALKQGKQYEATAVIQIEAPEVSETLAGAAVRTNDSAQRVKLIEQRMMSRDNLIRVIEKYQIFANEPGKSVNEQVALFRGAITVEQILTTAQAWMPGGVPSGLIITVRNPDPVKARDVANELMYGVVEASRERSIEQAKGALELFTTEEERVAGEIDALEARIADFKQQNSPYLEDGVKLLQDELSDLRQTALEIDQQIVDVTTAGARVRGEVAEQQVALLQEKRQVINARVAEIDRIFAGAPAVERDLNALERELQRKQDQYSVVTRRKAEAEMGQLLEERQQGSRFEVLETALLPEAPISRSRRQIAMMGGVASVMAAFGVALLLELLNPAIRTPAQMERALGISPVVSIPRVSVRRERVKRKLAIFGGLAALILAVPVSLRLFSGKLADMGILPGSSVNSR
ncbi:MAG: chain-length determining protein [Roseivivax sp.]|nr:chain-length determining protein [Roseivivax sp.]